MLYTLLYMASLRTQIYLTQELRARLDEVCQLESKTLAEVVRQALDQFLASSKPNTRAALERAFGAAPKLQVPDRNEWDRGG